MDRHASGDHHVRAGPDTVGGRLPRSGETPLRCRHWRARPNPHHASSRRPADKDYTDASRSRGQCHPRRLLPRWHIFECHDLPVEERRRAIGRLHLRRHADRPCHHGLPFLTVRQPVPSRRRLGDVPQHRQGRPRSAGARLGAAKAVARRRQGGGAHAAARQHHRHRPHRVRRRQRFKDVDRPVRPDDFRRRRPPQPEPMEGGDHIVRMASEAATERLRNTVSQQQFELPG